MHFSSLLAFTLSAVSLVNAAQIDLAPVFTFCNKPGVVALTFDDGPYTFSPEILKTCREFNVLATFFVNGNNWDCIYDMNATLANVIDAGHQLGSHSWAHKDLTTLNRKDINSEISKTLDAIQNMVGVRPAAFRPPYGNYNDDVRQEAAVLGQHIVNWNFDSGDSLGKTVNESQAAYTNAAAGDKTQESIIALNHETLKSTATDMIRKVIPILQAKGWTFVRMDECTGKPAYLNVTTPKPKDATWTCK